MTNYNDRELDKKIHSFMTKKMQKYPELDVSHPASKTVTMPKLTLRMLTTTRYIKAH